MLTTVMEQQNESSYLEGEGEGEQEQGKEQILTFDDDDKVIITEPKVSWYKFDNMAMAQGYMMCGFARGGIIMSNLFLSSSFLFLASQEAGCLNETGDDVLKDCEGEVYGFEPASFVSTIAVVSGVLSAIFMPIIGAMIDCTRHRRTVGIASATMLLLIQATQMGTSEKTWFPMVILQALAGVLFEMQVICSLAYLPDMAQLTGEGTMRKHTATFIMIQFAASILFLVLVIAVSMIFGLGDVGTGRLAIGMNLVWASSAFYIAWNLLPNVEARHCKPPGRSIVTVGFQQVFLTIRKINTHYKHGLRWFLLAVIFAEAAAYAFTVVAVIYLKDTLSMTASEVGLFFVVTLVGALPGTLIGPKITARLDPNRSWQLSIFAMVIWTAGGSVLVNVLPRSLVYVWGLVIGCILGWFYPTENLFFSLCLPEGQEAELAGFFAYCTRVLSWVPPLVFTALVEANVSQTYAVVSVTGFFIIAIGFLRCCAPWNEILQECGRLKLDQDNSSTHDAIPNDDNMGAVDKSEKESDLQ